MKLTKSKLKQIIREEVGKITEYEDSWGSGPEFTEEEQAVREAIDDLAKAVEAMGRSNPDLTDDYQYLFRVLQKAGVRTAVIAKMV